jgi:hypothetical protein
LDLLLLLLRKLELLQLVSCRRGLLRLWRLLLQKRLRLGLHLLFRGQLLELQLELLLLLLLLQSDKLQLLQLLELHLKLLLLLLLLLLMLMRLLLRLLLRLRLRLLPLGTARGPEAHGVCHGLEAAHRCLCPARAAEEATYTTRAHAIERLPPTAGSADHAGHLVLGRCNNACGCGAVLSAAARRRGH